MAKRRSADASVKNSGNNRPSYSDTANIQNNPNVPKSLNKNKLLKKTNRNMAKAEARTHEVPLWTEKTAELERRELEEK